LQEKTEAKEQLTKALEESPDLVGAKSALEELD
jgi:hypothetical protein